MTEKSRKMCIIGDGGVGKTSLTRRFMTNMFDENYISTLGTVVSKKTLKTKNQKTGKKGEVKLIIWDITGQDEFKRIHTSAFKGAKGAFIVCDSTRKVTLAKTELWRDRLYAVSGRIPILLLVNKTDLKGKRDIEQSDIDRVAASLGTTYLLTSAKDGSNVNNAFDMIAAEVMEDNEPLAYERKITEEGYPPLHDIADEMIMNFSNMMNDQPVARAIVRKQFTAANVDFRRPSKEGLIDVANRLTLIMNQMGGKEKADKFKKETMDLIRTYEEKKW
jgi:small GTP-binding protein